MNKSFYVGAIGAAQTTKRLSVIANNLSNVNNTGFKPKKVAFSELIEYNIKEPEEAVTNLQAGAGTRVARTYTSFEAGAFQQSGSELDFAIAKRNTFFAVQDPENGDLSYTRDGHFHRAQMEDGFYLATDSNKLVLDQNGQPIRLRELEEGEDEENPNQDINLPEDETQRVSLYTFTHPSRLLSVGDNEFAPPEDMAPILVENPRLTTGAVESSGTDLAKEMVRIIECQRAYAYALRMVTTSDEIVNTINALRQ